MKEFICMLKTLVVMAILVKFYSQKQHSTGVLIITALKNFSKLKEKYVQWSSNFTACNFIKNTTPLLVMYSELRKIF